ncbi:MAG: anti-sigma factor [Actinomycetota bacterium]|nr:anti-sigma factor [Actinomycetota bacterium]
MADDELDELLGAYALDAVSDDERRQVAEYIERNPRARAEVESHREVAAHLAFGGAAPPPNVWDRIAAEIDSAVPEPGPQLLRVMGDDKPRPRRRAWLAAAAVGTAAAAGAVAITLAVTGDSQQPTELNDAIEQAYGDAWADPEGRRADLVSPDGAMTAEAVVAPDGRGFVSARALPPLEGNETYQVWGVYGDGDIISLGVIGSRPDIEPFTARGDIDAVVITRERAGGVVSSKNDPLLTGDLA